MGHQGILSLRVAFFLFGKERERVSFHSGDPLFISSQLIPNPGFLTLSHLFLCSAFFLPSIFVCLQFSVIKEGELLSTTTPEKQTDIYLSSELFFHKTERKMCDTNVIFRKQHSLFYLSHTIDSFILGLIWLTSSGPLLSTA